MSLAGKLEDLGLNDILQILALSRKSGVLRLRNGERGLDLFVRSGSIVAARPQPSVSGLHQFFVQQRILAPAQQERFLQILRDKEFRVEPWVEFWARTFDVSTDDTRSWAERFLIWLVADAGQWDTGDFSFELDPGGDAVRKITQVPVFPYVPDGLSAQFLAMESARLADESSSGLAASDPGDQTITGLMPPGPEPSRAERLLLVEDRPDVADKVAEGLRSRGYPTVAVAYSVDGAIDVIRRAEHDGWIVVSDLVMPKRDRSGVLGGLEVAQELADHARVAEVYLCTDLISPEIERQGQEAGARGFITKPGRKAWKTDALAALRKFVQQISTTIGPPPEPEPEPEPELSEVEGDIDEDDPLAALLQEGDLNLPEPRTERGVQLLRQMVEELVNPNADSEISLLILRFAADLFQRAVIFAVNDDAFVVLGEAGVEPAHAPRVRGLRLDRGQGSLLDRVVDERRSHVGRAEEHPVHADLFRAMGGPEPYEVFVGPVLAGERVVAMLYADQVPTQSQIRDVETLEIFLGQAGMALERAWLRRQIRDLDRRGKDSGNSS